MERSRIERAVRRCSGKPLAAGGLLLMAAAWAAPAAAQSSGPPFLRGLAAERGVSLPKPYGIGIVYSDGSQDLALDEFLVSVDGGPREGVDFIQLSDSELDSQAVLVKGDVWLFPFLNVFGFIGQATNDLSSGFSVAAEDLVAYAGSDACAEDGDRPVACDRVLQGSIARSTDATQYGGGANLAIGRGDYFALVGLVYATTDADGTDTQLDSFSVSPRLGRRWSMEQGGELALYLGASFFDSEVEVSNQVVVEFESPEIEDIVVDYTVSQSNEDDWSYLGGLNWDITRSVTLQGEYSVGARDGLLLSLNYRFGGE